MILLVCVHFSRGPVDVYLIASARVCMPPLLLLHQTNYLVRPNTAQGNNTDSASSFKPSSDEETTSGEESNVILPESRLMSWRARNGDHGSGSRNTSAPPAASGRQPRRVSSSPRPAGPPRVADRRSTGRKMGSATPAASASSSRGGGSAAGASASRGAGPRPTAMAFNRGASAPASAGPAASAASSRGGGSAASASAPRVAGPRPTTTAVNRGAGAASSAGPPASAASSLGGGSAGGASASNRGAGASAPLTYRKQGDAGSAPASRRTLTTTAPSSSVASRGNAGGGASRGSRTLGIIGRSGVQARNGLQHDGDLFDGIFGRSEVEPEDRCKSVNIDSDMTGQEVFKSLVAIDFPTAERATLLGLLLSAVAPDTSVRNVPLFCVPRSMWRWLLLCAQTFFRNTCVISRPGCYSCTLSTKASLTVSFRLPPPEILISCVCSSACRSLLDQTGLYLDLKIS